MTESAKKQIVKSISAMSGTYSPYDIFTDWVEMMALTIQNSCWVIHNELYQEREKRFNHIREKYTDAESEKFSEMFAWLCEAFGNEMTDILGEVYMESGCGNKYTGQFFTPFHLSRLLAALAIPENYDGSEHLTINEPSVGGGGMIIAVADELHKRGIPFQRCMRVIAQDLDWKAVYMAYVQLSLLGIHAEIAQGDTLSEPYNGHNLPKSRVFLTPRRMGLFI